MPVERRSRRLFAVALAVPVILLVYAATLVGRLWSAFRPAVATALGATVIGSVYVETAWRHTPAQRISPVRAAAALALAMVVAHAGMPGASVYANSPLETVVKNAIKYKGTPYKWGATGPNYVDCSGLMYRIFLDAGELPRIGGKRMTALGYYNWFKSRGQIATKSSKGARGDLVYYTNRSHIGIYLGSGRVISALTTGVKEHGLLSLNARFVAFLKVNWGTGDTPPPPPPPNNDNNDSNDTATAPEEQASGGPLKGLALGTMNLRRKANPHADIIGWVSRGKTFTILGEGNSPSGALWYNVKLGNGKKGWVWSRWVEVKSN